MDKEFMRHVNEVFAVHDETMRNLAKRSRNGRRTIKLTYADIADLQFAAMVGEPVGGRKVYLNTELDSYSLGDGEYDWDDDRLDCGCCSCCGCDCDYYDEEDDE